MKRGVRTDTSHTTTSRTLMDSTEQRPALSSVQLAVVRHYADGDYEGLVQSKTDAAGMDDALLTFLLEELGPSTGCDSNLEAVRRLDAAMRQIEAVRSALYTGVAPARGHG
jgi:hypothetical protein